MNGSLSASVGNGGLVGVAEKLFEAVFRIVEVRMAPYLTNLFVDHEPVKFGRPMLLVRVGRG